MLPQRVVGILNRQRRKISRTAVQPRRIKPRKIPPQNPQRPPVPGDVMQHQKQYVLVPRQRKQMRPQRRLHAKVEPSPRRPRQRRAQPSLAHRRNHQPRPRRVSRQDLLPRNPQPVREHRAQALVPLNQVPKRTFQRRRIERPKKPDRQRDRVGRAPPFQTVQEPQPTLRKRQRDLPRPPISPQPRPRRLSLPPKPCAKPLNRRRFEQAADRNLHIQYRTDTADQSQRQQRMAPKLEEVVVAPNPPDPQNLGKQTAQDLLLRRARQTPYPRRRQVRRRQRTPVELAVRRQRKTIQNHNRRRNHVVGKAQPHMRPQPRRIGTRPRRRHHIADQPLAPAPVLARNHRRLRHAPVPHQRCLDLPRLNAEPAQLHLPIRPPDKVQYPLTPPPRQIPGPVHPPPRTPKPVRNKPLRRQARAPHIPPRNPRPRNVKLPNNPGRHRLQSPVQHIHPRVPDRTTNRRGVHVLVIEDHGGRPDRGLGRSVEIGEPAPEASQRQREPARQRLAADQHREIPQSFGAVRRQRLPECRGALQDRGPGLLDRSRKSRRIFDDLSSGDGETRTTDEREEQFE